MSRHSTEHTKKALRNDPTLEFEDQADENEEYEEYEEEEKTYVSGTPIKSYKVKFTVIDDFEEDDPMKNIEGILKSGDTREFCIREGETIKFGSISKDDPYLNDFVLPVDELGGKQF